VEARAVLLQVTVTHIQEVAVALTVTHIQEVAAALAFIVILPVIIIQQAVLV